MKKEKPTPGAFNPNLGSLGDVSFTSTARGDIPYRGASKWNNLAAGTSGFFLKSNGAAADPSWAAVQTDALYTAPPAAASFTSVNVTTATLTDSSSGGLFLAAPDRSASTAECFVKSLAAGAYTFIIRMDRILGSTTFTDAGIVLRDSAGGKLITIEQYMFGDGPTLVVEQWNDANTRTATAFAGGNLHQLFPWFKIVDDGTTTRHYFYSNNGNDWLEFFNEGRTTFLTVAPNQIGLFAAANGGPVGVNVYSWAGA